MGDPGAFLDVGLHIGASCGGSDGVWRVETTILPRIFYDKVHGGLLDAARDEDRAGLRRFEASGAAYFKGRESGKRGELHRGRAATVLLTGGSGRRKSIVRAAYRKRARFS